MQSKSLFGPFFLITIGVVWLLVSLKVIPVENLWALTHFWPFFLIALGVGLILQNYLPSARWIVSLVLLAGVVISIVFAPQFGWAGGPEWNWFEGDTDFGGGVPGSGKVETETRSVKNFTAVDVRYPAEVIIQQGETESVEVQAEDNLLPQLVTEVRDGVLVITNKERSWAKRVDPNERVVITVTVKELSEVDFSSAGSLNLEGIKADELNLILSGAGHAILNDLAIKKLTVRLSGAGGIEANGTADDLNVRISGAGSFDGSELASTVADVSISGVGNADVRVEEDLTARVSGAGSVNYYGSPHVDETVSGIGSVNQAGK